jgi:hypothetical protein
MSTAAVVLDIEKAFNTTWHSGLLNKLTELEFLTSLINIIASFLTDRKCEVLVEGKFSTPRKIVTEDSQGSVLALTLYSLYTNHALTAPGTHLPLSADDNCIYMTEKYKRHVLCKLQ